ncbi:MAG: hypothetical protein JWO19_4002 [Bryobacterales bacterium]|nr:hypothetical protein [Bryobacterales bacterium]
MFFACLSLPALAQWQNVTNPKLPRTAHGEPDLSAPAPRTADGKPDLSGIWWVPDHSVEGVDAPPKYSLNLAADLDPDDLKMQPWAEALMNQRLADMRKDMPASRCLPWPVPAMAAVPVPFQIIQTPESIVILHEVQSMFRQIFLDGRVLSPNPTPTWLGYSAGRWERDTLVVDTKGFNDRSWLDGLGHPHTEDLHVIERYRRTDFGHMEIEFTIDDPKTYMKPWTNKMPVELTPPDTQLYEDVCGENERDAAHLVGR